MLTSNKTRTHATTIPTTIPVKNNEIFTVIVQRHLAIYCFLYIMSPVNAKLLKILICQILNVKITSLCRFVGWLKKMSGEDQWVNQCSMSGCVCAALLLETLWQATANFERLWIWAPIEQQCRKISPAHPPVFCLVFLQGIRVGTPEGTQRVRFRERLSWLKFTGMSVSRVVRVDAFWALAWLLQWTYRPLCGICRNFVVVINMFIVVSASRRFLGGFWFG